MFAYSVIKSGFKAANNANDKAGAGSKAPEELNSDTADGPVGTAVDKTEIELREQRDSDTEDADRTEGGGKTAAKPGQPSDPQNASSKKRSYVAVLLAGFAMAIDFTMSMMSIQAFYYSIRGPQRLYGLTFGAYDLTSVLMAPIFGYWSDRTKTFKVQFATGGWVNFAGNLIYAFTFLAGEWYVMLIARLVAGIGGATLGLGSSYIAQTTTLEARQVKLMQYRVSQSMARMLGPFVGYIFLGLPFVNSNSSTALKVFNWYTMPGWFAAFVVGCITVIFYFVFTDPSKQNEHLVEHPPVNKADIDPRRLTKFRTVIGLWLTLIVFASFIQFAYYSNLFALFAGQYHAISTQTDQWKVFVAVGVGAATAAIIYRQGIRRLPVIFDERVLSALSAWIMFIALMLVIPWHGATSVSSEVTFYASSGLFGASVVIASSSVETFFSKKITQYHDITGGHVGKLLGAFYMASSLGRFAGPLVAGAVTQIATPQGVVFFCPGGGQVDSNGSPTCSSPDACAITADNYYVNGCVLYHAIPFYSALAGAQFVLCLAIHGITYVHWRYDD